MYVRIALIVFGVVLFVALAACTSKRDNYWGNVATGVGQTIKR